MRKLIVLMILVGYLVAGCAGYQSTGTTRATSMPPSQFYTEFPAATKTIYMTGVEVDSAMLEGRCRGLDWHFFDAPVGPTVHDDLRNGADGVDAIVKNDGGNAYRIEDFEWRERSYGTQLHISFRSFLCDF